MTTKRRSIACFSAALASALLAGCGSEPLVGRWRADIRSTLPSSQQMVIASADVLIEFKSDRTMELTLTAVASAAAGPASNCRSVTRSTGSTWQSTMASGTNSVAITASSSTVREVTGCLDSTRNQAAALTTDGAVTATTANYSINGSTLILTGLTGTASLTLTRQ
jgi:hypothetical protein